MDRIFLIYVLVSPSLWKLVCGQGECSLDILGNDHQWWPGEKIGMYFAFDQDIADSILGNQDWSASVQQVRYSGTGQTISVKIWTSDLVDASGCTHCASGRKDAGQAIGDWDIGESFEFVDVEGNAQCPPTKSPTDEPSPSPTDEPTPSPTDEPTPSPSGQPSPSPSDQPTPSPTGQPSPSPTDQPSPSPTDQPTPSPSGQPSPSPSDQPTPSPSEQPSPSPTDQPSPSPTNEPSPSPTDQPTPSPSGQPSPSPSDQPTPSPTDQPTPSPTNQPSPSPTNEPTPSPTDQPTPSPSDQPTPSPTDQPTPSPTDEPTASPTDEPTASPTDEPTPSPTLDGCDFNINTYLDTCYCDGTLPRFNFDSAKINPITPITPINNNHNNEFENIMEEVMSLRNEYTVNMQYMTMQIHYIQYIMMVILFVYITVTVCIMRHLYNNNLLQSKRYQKIYNFDNDDIETESERNVLILKK